MHHLGALIALPLLPSCSNAADDTTRAVAASAIVPLTKPHEAWRDQISPEAYAVLFDEDTERAFTSPLNDEKREGTFICAACFLPMFRSANKFDSGTGWPSFTAPLSPNVVAYHFDPSHGTHGVEATCNVCDAHLGHVFPDGPRPSGLRFCTKAVSLRKACSPESRVAPTKPTPPRAAIVFRLRYRFSSTVICREFAVAFGKSCIVASNIAARIAGSEIERPRLLARAPYSTFPDSRSRIKSATSRRSIVT
jgi:peptide-methionine (R)-S-oxide reductase